MSLRETNGRFTRRAPDRVWTRAEVAAVYEGYFAGVVKHQGLNRAVVDAMLALPGRGRNFDVEWRKAAYARQLAMYLAHVVAGCPQKLIADAAGTDHTTVCKAQTEIEMLRDHGDYDTLCEIVAAEVAHTDHQVPA